MAAKKFNSQPDEKTIFIVPRNKFKQQVTERVKIGEELSKIDIRDEDQLEKLSDDFYNWDDYNRELLKRSFNNQYSEYYRAYKQVNLMVGMLDVARNINTNSLRYRIEHIKTGIQNCVNNLSNLIAKTDLIDTNEIDETLVDDKNPALKFYNIGFIVHGHNELRKFEIERFIEKELKIDTIILHDKANLGQTIIEKFEKHSEVDFAVALWTADDVGKSKKEEELKNRARQNVVFETGFFIGKLGRSRVIVLYEEGVEIPSDYSGVIFVPLNSEWKESLRREILAIYNS